MRKQFLLFFLFSSLSFSQVNDIVNIVNIFNIQLGLSIKSVKEKWDCENFDEFAKLIYQTDDFLKYEAIEDSFFLGASFHFVDDSLFMFNVVTKQTFKYIDELSLSLNENFEAADSVLYTEMGKKGSNAFQIFKMSYWSKLNSVNNSLDNISTSQETIEKILNVFSFSKSNSLLMNKAKLLNKLQIKL